jgi:hypothetical protein
MTKLAHFLRSGIFWLGKKINVLLTRLDSYISRTGRPASKSTKIAKVEVSGDENEKK